MRAPGQTPSVIQRVQNFGRLISQQGVGGTEGVPQFEHPFPPAHCARRRGRVIELADFQCVVVCLIVVDMVARGDLERNKPEKVGRKMQACRCQNNEVVNKGDRPYTP
jgi:hypothetical protein